MSNRMSRRDIFGSHLPFSGEQQNCKKLFFRRKRQRRGRQAVDCDTRFAHPNPELGKGGVMPQLRRLFPPPVASHPAGKASAPPDAMLIAWRSHPSRDARTKTPDDVAHHLASSWHHAFGTFAPHTATDTQGVSIAGVASAPEASATDKPHCLLWLPPCTVTADAMRPLGKPSSCPQTHHDQGRSCPLDTRPKRGGASGLRAYS